MEVIAPEAAARRIAGIARSTRLVPHRPGLSFKLETDQPIRSFKIRGAANAMALATDAALAHGVWTASAGNMAQGVCWCARERGIPATIVVPDHAPATKTDAITRLGGTFLKVPFDMWWRTLQHRAFPGVGGLFVHPFADQAVMEGNATIALELLAEASDIETVLVPWGGGGLACGIALALRTLKPNAKVIAVEVETAAPLTASLAAGAPATVAYERTIIDGMGSSALAPEMWPLAHALIHSTIVVSVAEVGAAVKLLHEQHDVVAEGAGAAPVAAALKTTLPGHTIALISGGNIDPAVHAALIA
jgi:threonine dehydratase